MIGWLIALALYLLALPLAADVYTHEVVVDSPEVFQSRSGRVAFWVTVALWPVVEVYNLVAKGEKTNGE